MPTAPNRIHKGRPASPTTTLIIRGGRAMLPGNDWHAPPAVDIAIAGSEIAGPALIQEHGTTTVLFEQDTCTVAPSGELIIAVGAA